AGRGRTGETGRDEIWLGLVRRCGNGTAGPGEAWRGAAWSSVNFDLKGNAHGNQTRYRAGTLGAGEERARDAAAGGVRGAERGFPAARPLRVGRFRRGG